MTIQEMLVREDIYTILSQTLEDYFLSVWGRIVDVKVNKSPLRNRYVIYPRLGVVISRFPSWKVAKDIYTQFNVQGDWIRKIIAWGYITICFLTGGLLASRSLFVSDRKWCTRDRYIMPCNRKIRIFDFKQGYVDAILKVGFNDKYFKNELKYRVNPRYHFIPPIIEYGNRWYREKLLAGRALVRLNEPHYSEAIVKTKDALGKMYKDSIHFESLSSYCERLTQYLQRKIPYLAEHKGVNVRYIESVLKKANGLAQGIDIQIPLVVSHGDMQTGNIMVDKSGEVTIYDWETAGERSIWYDMGKLLLYSQRKGRYAYMVEHRNEKEVKDALLSFDSNNYPMTCIISILVLEELAFFVDEVCDLPGKMGAEIMERLTDELKNTIFS